MLYFLDTSALVKRYHSEIGTETVDRLFRGEADVLLISALSLTETVATLKRKLNRKEINADDFRIAIGELYRDCFSGRIGIGDIQRTIIFSANDLITEHNLSGPDAIILATALKFQAENPIFVCADIRSGLLHAAEKSGLSTLNPIA